MGVIAPLQIITLFNLFSSVLVIVIIYCVQISISRFTVELYIAPVGRKKKPIPALLLCIIGFAVIHCLQLVTVTELHVVFNECESEFRCERFLFLFFVILEKIRCHDGRSSFHLRLISHRQECVSSALRQSFFNYRGRAEGQQVLNKLIKSSPGICTLARVSN